MTEAQGLQPLGFFDCVFNLGDSREAEHRFQDGLGLPFCGSFGEQLLDVAMARGAAAASTARLAHLPDGLQAAVVNRGPDFVCLNIEAVAQRPMRRAEQGSIHGVSPGNLQRLWFGRGVETQSQLHQ
jgi:hypothetical protein